MSGKNKGRQSSGRLEKPWVPFGKTLPIAQDAWGSGVLKVGGQISRAISPAKECDMPFSLNACAELLSQSRVRHHVDAEQSLIRVVFVTRDYRNLRGERLLIAQIAVPEDGQRCRVTIERAFAAGADAAATCLALCQAAADTPLVGIEYDADQENLRMVVETTIEDGGLTRRQLLSMLDAVVGAAEIWQVSAIGTKNVTHFPEFPQRSRTRKNVA
jgi:hypothetical protein